MMDYIYLFSKKEERGPEDWSDYLLVIIPKKGDLANCNNRAYDSVPQPLWPVLNISSPLLKWCSPCMMKTKAEVTVDGATTPHQLSTCKAGGCTISPSPQPLMW